MAASEKNTPLQVFNPQTDTFINECVCGEKLIRWAYTSPCAPLFQRFIFRNRLASRLLGHFFDSAFSRHKIPRFIKELDINLEEARVPENGFRSFNEFFSRQLKSGTRPFDATPDVLCSPADARTLVFPAGGGPENNFPVKGLQFSVRTLLARPERVETGITRDLEQGQIVVLRLCPADYHRFHFPGTGEIISQWTVPGYLNSVNPLPLNLGIKVFEENYREVNILRLENFGPCAFVEVGAFGVGRIKQTHQQATFGKMDEKGYFQFGGSTVVLILPRGAVTFREDLVHWSSQGIETLLRAGNTLGTLARTQTS